MLALSNAPLPLSAPAPDWMETVAQEVERRLRGQGVHLTLGGEPTVVPLDPEGPEWSITADGPTKLPLARLLAQILQRDVWPGSTLLFCPGKCYEGEVNPRWALRLFTGSDGTPPVRWPEPSQPGAPGAVLAPGQARAWLEDLGERLGVPLQPLELRDPLDPRRRIWAVPLTVDEPLSDNDADPIHWKAVAWPLEERLCELSRATGPAGLRLPLEHFPAGVPRQVLTLELQDGQWDLFLPPLLRHPLVALLQAVADSLGGLAAPGLGGMLPSDLDDRWQVLGLTADPGVLEINLPVCHGWRDYDGWLRRLELAAGSLGLRSWKLTAAGQQQGTGGGNHLLWGGPNLASNPFFSRPAWLVGVLRYWQHHPALAYLFSGPGVGPASQAPRPDEAAGELFDLELAYRAIEAADGTPSLEPYGDHRGLIGETLRHLHADRSGNNHRSEISFDKFWNPGTPAGCLGLIEFRALESVPDQNWTSAIALLWSALAAHLLDPRNRPAALKDWGERLHDRQLLPSQLWADLETILAELAQNGLALDAAPFRELWQWRFAPLLHWRGAAPATGDQEIPELILRPALEPWPLICDFPREGGFTSRFIDGSLRRFEVEANSAFRHSCKLIINDRPLELAKIPEVLAVRYRQQRLYPCLHPAIEPHWPLNLVVSSPGGDQHFALREDGLEFAESDLPSPLPQTWHNHPWQGRRRSDAVTVDLRLG